ncbi:MAG: class I SAM-dependent methyltransferase [Gemmatimonadaceae bacterium]
MSFIDRLDAAWYPGESHGWDSDRFRAHLLGLVRPDHRVLDLGAGRGIIPQMNLQGVVAHVTGVDPDPCVAENPYLDEAVVLPDPRQGLPFPDASFDVVMTSNVLEHVEAPSQLFREVWRLLRPGGLFVSKTPNRGHYVALIASATPHGFHEWINGRRGHSAEDTYPTLYRANTRRAVRRLAEEAGFEIAGLTTWEGAPNYLRIMPPAYPLGIGYERLVNSTDALADFRAVLVATLRKPR